MSQVTDQSLRRESPSKPGTIPSSTQTESEYKIYDSILPSQHQPENPNPPTPPTSENPDVPPEGAKSSSTATEPPPPEKEDVSDVELTCGQKIRRFFSTHWKGILLVVLPPTALLVTSFFSPLNPRGYIGYIIVLMAVLWMTEAIPLAVTGLIPMFAFPLLGVMDSISVARAYFNDTVLMFLGSMFLAYAIECSGFHMRLAYVSIKVVGFTHFRLLLAYTFITMFISIWINNTAATSMMLPISFAILKVFESLGTLTMFETTHDGEQVPTSIAVCYFCTSTFAASIGGIGTIVGTGTNVAFKGMFEMTYPEATESIDFHTFSAINIPYMIFLQVTSFFWMAIVYLGFMRPNSEAARRTYLSPESQLAARKAVEQRYKDLGPMTFYEYSVLVVFLVGMFLFFSRSPGMFAGWADLLSDFNHVTRVRYIQDSCCCFLVTFFMFLYPSTLHIFKYCKAKYASDCPDKGIPCLLEWNVAYPIIPWSFAFLLGSGFAVAIAAKKTGFSDAVGQSLMILESLSPENTVLVLSIVTTILTNFASSTAVANILCPIAMALAEAVKLSPLWLCFVAGVCSSWAFMLPVGSTGNLVVQGATNMKTSQMIVAGSGITVLSVIGAYIFLGLWLQVFYDGRYPPWAGKQHAVTRKSMLMRLLPKMPVAYGLKAPPSSTPSPSSTSSKSKLVSGPQTVDPAYFMNFSNVDDFPIYNFYSFDNDDNIYYYQY